MTRRRSYRAGFVVALAALALSVAPRASIAQDKPAGKPIKALLVLGGCCHDYARQQDILSKGISERANVEWTIAYDPDKGTKHLNPVYEKDDWYKGFDVVVHDECSADVKDPAIIQRVLKPHQDGLPGVVLHCGMHSFRGEGYPKATKWFEFTGLASTGHGPQLPIDITYVDKDHPVTKGLADWTTINEELYNNVNGKLHDTAKPLARGKQVRKNKDGSEKVDEAVVAWVNTYNGKAKVFATTLGHNNGTVADPRYLNLITRGLLWSVDKLDDQHFKPSDKAVEIPGGNVAPKAPEKKSDEKKPAAAAPAAPKAEAKPAANANDLVPLDLARGKAATASSVQDAHAPGNAFDGDVDSRWCASDGTVPQWLQVDLGKTEEITGVRLTWEKDGKTYWYKVEGSTDGKAWDVLVDEDKSPAKEQIRTHAFTCCGDGKGLRYVRLSVNGVDQGAWASLYDFQVYGKQMVPASQLEKEKPKPTAAKNNKGSKAAGEAAASFDGAKELSKVKVPAGFKATMFAGPDDGVSYTTCVAASPTGELYVGIDEQGSLGKQPGRGRVVRVTDTNDDGKADQVVTFAKMDHPRGTIWDGSTNTLYVLHPPFLSAYVDENNDGVADRSEVLVKGIANEKIQEARGADHTTNGIRLGIDGWIYVAMGDFGTLKATAKDGTDLVMHGGGVVRVRTDGSGLEDYSFGQRNIYDVAIDPFLNCFTRDNTNDGGGWDVRLSHVIPTGNYGYPRLFKNFPDEIVQPLDVYGGGSPCGSLFVDEPTTVPGKWGNGLYTVEWGRSIVYRHPLEPSGAGFKAGQEEFLAVPRGTDMDVDARGRFYVSTWANGGFSYSGPNVGYVVRVAPEGGPAAPAVPEFKKASDEQLVNLIASPSAVLREAAQREILKRGDKPAVEGGLTKLIASAAPLQQRVAAVFTLKQLRGSKADAALAELSKDDALREFALRALADKANDKGVPAGPFVAALADKNPRVRLIAAWGLGRLGKAEAAAAILPLTADADALVAHVAVNSLVTLKATDAALAAIETSASPAQLPGALRVLQRLHDVKVVDALVGRIGKTHDAAAKGQLYAALCRLYNREADYDGSWWGTRPDTSGPYYRVAEWEGTPKVQQALQTALKSEKGDALRAVLLQLPRNKIKMPEAAAMIASLAKTDPAFKSFAVDLAAASAQGLGVEDIVILKEVASSDKEQPESRVKAIRTLQKAKEPAALDALIDSLATLVGVEKPAGDLWSATDEALREGKHADRIPYFTTLASSDDPAKREVAYGVLVSVATSKLAKPKAKDEAAKAIEAAWAKPASAASLLRAVGRAKAGDYKEKVQASLADKDATVADAAKYAANRLGLGATAGGKPASPGEAKVLIEALPYEKALATATKEKGDVALGAELFVKQGCVACHTTSADQPPTGPFLGGISTRYSRAELCESILKPSAKIMQGFETQWFKTEDDIVEGFVTREAGDEIELRNATGVVTTLKTKDVFRRGKRETSVMPEGLAAKLTPQELASLLAYLESLKGK